MTQTKEVITKRMAQKTDFNITGAGGKVENKPISEPKTEEITTIPTPKAKKSGKKRKKN